MLATLRPITNGGDHSEGEEEGVVEVPLDAAVQIVRVVPQPAAQQYYPNYTYTTSLESLSFIVFIIFP